MIPVDREISRLMRASIREKEASENRQLFLMVAVLVIIGGLLWWVGAPGPKQPVEHKPITPATVKQEVT